MMPDRRAARLCLATIAGATMLWLALNGGAVSGWLVAALWVLYASLAGGDYGPERKL